MSSPNPPPFPVSKKLRTARIVVGVIAAVLLLPVLIHVAARVGAAVLVFRIIPPPMEKKVDFLPSEKIWNGSFA